MSGYGFEALLAESELRAASQAVEAASRIRSLAARLGHARAELRRANEMVDEYAKMLEKTRAALAYEREVFARRIAGEFVAVPKPKPKPHLTTASLMARSEEQMP